MVSVVLFQGLLYAVVFACVGIVKMRTGIDVMGFIPFGSILISLTINVLFYLMLRMQRMQVKGLYCVTSVVFAIVGYYSMEYFVYFSTYVDYGMNINYEGIGEHISQFYNSRTNNPITFSEYCFLLGGGEFMGVMNGNGFSMGTGGVFINFLNPLVLIVIPIAFYWTTRPSQMYCKVCNKYMIEKQLFIFNTGDNFGDTMLEKIEQCIEHEDGVEMLREVMGANQELKDTSDEFVVGNYNYCDDCDQLFLVLVSYTIDEHGNHHKQGMYKKYPIKNKKFFRLIIR